MNLTAKILLGVFGGGGFTATTSWFIYDNVNPTLAKRYKDQWNPITLTINKPPEAPSEESYSGSSCFQRFFGNISIQKFSVLSGTSTNPSSSSKFNTLFKDSKSDIYGCAVGEKDNFYEVVLKNEEIGFATWYDTENEKYKQKTFILEKEDSYWKVKLGVWTTGKPSKDIDQIKDKTNTEKWSWWFYMPISKGQAPIPDNLQKWEDVFKGQNNNAVYNISKNEWSSGASGNHTGGEIPKFDQVQNLDNYCETQGSMRKPKPTEGDDVEKTLKVFCLFSK